MVSPRSIAMAMALSGAAVFPSVDAHGWILSPAPTFLDPYGDPSKFCGVINGNKLYPADVFNRSPEDNTNAFLARFKVDYTSLKQFFDKNDECGECGITKFGTAQKLPADGVVKWRNGGEGFVSSHEGPCEVWCDNTVVFQNDNCARNVPSGNMQIDVAKCNGAKKMVVLWIALHAVDWQVYKNCVALQDGVAPSTSAPPLTSTRPPTPSVTEYPVITPTPSPSTTEYPTPTTSNASSTTPSPLPFPTRKPAISTTTSVPATTAPTSSSPAPTTSAPTTSAPTTSRTATTTTATPTAKPTSPPATSPSKIAGGWQQCGGKGYTGATECVRGYHCQVVIEWYHQCIPNVAGEGELKTYEQCGGSSWTGKGQCKQGDECTKLDQWFSQCVPHKNP
ncbi:hypothetical protein DYB30_011043 [Aphanomyces astaci]|uniref:CBM1 domain-containing protein n=1 Tax=Aphanomyces astaci TaxID=112090 RepID=A0A397D7E6_APHAT|nr:hypothetical protein DYB38_009152 [Aphanomyces astaci]RHY56841.1 hypothetical protein DYB30_011043 [Aphanomyces astaci]